MKYYIYISDAKVDMLLPQVPHDIKKKIATEFGFDLKLLKAKRKVETESEENRISRLETVVSFIQEYGKVGSVDEPDEYFEGVLPMRMAPIKDEDSKVIYLAGETKMTVLGLAGSLTHVIGNTGEATVHISASSSWMAFKYVEECLRGKHKIQHREHADFGLDILADLNNELRGPYQTVEFLAKRLQFGFLRKTVETVGSCEGENHKTRQVLLGTPIYVALAE